VEFFQKKLYNYDIDRESGTPYLPSDLDYVYNGDSIYYDTIYKLEFTVALDYSCDECGRKKRDTPDEPFQLYLFDPTSFYTDIQNLPIFSTTPIFHLEDCDFEPNTFVQCSPSVDFCIPSDSEIAQTFPGAVQIGQQVKLVIVTQNDVNNNIQSLNPAGGKRGLNQDFFDEYIVSLGNPSVFLSVNPDKRSSSLNPGCAALSDLTSR